MELDRDQFLRRYGHSNNDIDESGLDWAKLVEIYNAHHERSAELKTRLDELELRLRSATPPPHAVRGRVKDPEHVIDKIIRKAIAGDKNYRNIDVSTYAHVMTDLVGARVLHLRKRDWFPIDRFIRDNWNVFLHEESPPTAYVREGDPDPIVQDYKRWGLELVYRPRGYRSVHYVIKPDLFKNFWAEIQVRTLIEEAWSEIDHALSYPRETNSKAAAQYLLMFNRIAGAADEMGSFVSRYWDQLDETSKSTGQSGAVLDAADVASLARVLKCSTATVMAALESSSRGTDSTYKRWSEARNQHENNPIVAGSFGDRLREYYGAQSGRVRQYRIRCGGRDFGTPNYTTESRIGMCCEPDRIEITLDPKAPTWRCDVPLHDLGLKVCRYMIEKNVRIWNDPIYSVRSATLEGVLRLSLSIDEYFSYRFTCGLLEDEFFDAEPFQDQGRSPSADPRPSQPCLPLRDKLLPKVSLHQFEQRVSAGGITALCAFAGDDKDGFHMPLHRRSPHVADGRGLLTVVPKAIHQPGVGNHGSEREPYWTVLREIFEEIFSGSTAERNPEIRDHEWFLKECKAVKLIHERQHGSRVCATGFAIDSLKGSWLISHLVVVEDKEYWKRYSELTPMWEQKDQFEWVSSRDSGKIAELVNKESWATDGLFSFVEGLFALREFFPHMVCLPADLDRYLDGPAENQRS